MSDFYAGQRVLIAGGLGFVGSHLAIDLAQRGAHVTIIDALQPAGGGRVSHVQAVSDCVEIHLVDLRDSARICPLVRNQSIIFSLAGQTSHLDSMHDPMQDLELNSRAHLSLLECWRRENGSAKLVFTSTRQVYGRALYLPVDEQHAVSPSDINGVHKLATENYLQLFSRVYGLTCGILRLTNTYGPHMDLRPHKGFVGVFLDRALNGEKIRLFGNGNQLRDFNFVSDVVAALRMVGQGIEHDCELFNLGHYQHHSLKEFVETLGQVIPLRYECQAFPDELKRIDIGDYYGSYAKLNRLCGWNPQVALREGLEQTISYFRERRSYGTCTTTLARVPAFEYRNELAPYRSEVLNAFAKVIDSGNLILGPEVAAFEDEFSQYVGARNAIGVSSGTDALIVALRALNIGPGDEVITVANGPAPTIAAIRACGALPRLVDVDPQTLQIDAAKAEAAISDRTRCIIPLHLYGSPADIESLLDICRRYQLRLIEDCAQAHGTRFDGQHVGVMGDIGCFSFYPTKNLGAFGDAGMCVTQDSDLAQRLREQACYGFRGDRIAHSEGLNCRLDELQAAALRVRLRALPTALTRRETIARYYESTLQDLPIKMLRIINRGAAAWHQFVIRTHRRDHLIGHLSSRGIDVGVHYATPVHHMPAYAQLHLNVGPLDVTEQACREVVSLPMYPELNDHQLERVVIGIREFFSR